MPLIRGTGGQSATAERYKATANGPKMPSPLGGEQKLFQRFSFSWVARGDERCGTSAAQWPK
jgi:hypothetical protein